MWDLTKKFIRFLGPKGCTVVAFAAVVITFLLQNMDPADVDFLLWQLIEVPKVYLLLATFGSGFLFAVLLLKWPTRRRKPAAPAPQRH